MTGIVIFVTYVFITKSTHSVSQRGPVPSAEFNGQSMVSGSEGNANLKIIV